MAELPVQDPMLPHNKRILHDWLHRHGLVAAVRRLVLVIFIGVIAGVGFYVVNRSSPAPLHLWDEALYANNALDMVRSGHYGVYTVNDTIDHHNTKPPLVLWMQAASGAAFGFTEFAIRLPVYCALAGVIILLMVYCRRLTGSWLAGSLAAILALTTKGLIRHHVFITGDLDGVLVFWTTWIVLHLLACLQKPRMSGSDYVLLTTLFCAGYLTKSTAVLLIAPSLFAAGMLYRHKFLQAFFQWRSVWSMAALALFILAYNIVRSVYDPGYWHIVWNTEFLRLTNDIQPWLHLDSTYYFEAVYKLLFHEYILLTAAVAPFYFGIRDTAHKRWAGAVLVVCIIYLLFISLPPVKLSWYDAPAYPLACAVLGLMVTEVARVAFNGRRLWHLVCGLAIVIVVAVTVKDSFIRVKDELSTEPHIDHAHQTVPDALKIFHDRHPAVAHFSVLISKTPARFSHSLDELTFYRRAYDLDEQKLVTVSDSVAGFRSGDTIICSREMLASVRDHHAITVLDSTAAGAFWIRLQPEMD